MTKLPAVPVISSEDGLSYYLNEIKKFPILSNEEEYLLAMRWRDHQDSAAAHKLVTSHLRLVAKIAMSFRGYGLPISELISEGNIGMMQAVKRFEPEKGFRLSTYAMWWIRASIQEYILHSWSLVKMGTTAAQKKLFFNLRRLKGQLEAFEDGDLRPENVKAIAEALNVSHEEVINMDRRLTAPDHSLNAPMRMDGDAEWQDWLVDDNQVSQETTVADAQELDQRRGFLVAAMNTLSERERDIIMKRRLTDDPITLESLSEEYGVSRERVRQIEVRAFQKIQNAVKRAATDREAAVVSHYG